MNRSLLSISMLSIVALAGCAEEDTDPTRGSSAEVAIPAGVGMSDVAPPSDPHWVLLGSERRLVFSRSAADVQDGSPVAGYKVCTSLGTCVDTRSNFIDVAADVGFVKAVVYAVDLEGHLSAASGEAESSSGVMPSPIDAYSAGEHTAQAQQALSGAPTLTYSPAYGDLTFLGQNSSSNQTNGPWSFWAHQTGFHKPSGGIQASDDTWAYDVNLNVTGTGGDLDKGMEILPAGYGTVVKWGGSVSPGTDSTKSVLIEHNAGGDIWWSGYLHSRVVYAKLGDYVTPFTVLGLIGGSTGYPNHLHFAVYAGQNQYGKLKSSPVSVHINTVNITLDPWSTVGVNQTKLLGAQAWRNHAAGLCLAPLGLNSAAVYDNTWWKSSNTSILTVDGNGNVKGKSKGSATVTVWYGGTSASKLITVL